ncbi:MAG: DUF2867 domain-containing protein [Rikenellaceae bacterium]|nr:DUF2867 domain-containing protein [Rikenellaceae bacterium]
MKAVKSKIPDISGVGILLPADYIDNFKYQLDHRTVIAARDIMERFWTDHPSWIRAMFSLRDIMVKPFGLKSDKSKDGKFKEIINEQSEYIVCLNDKHLDAYLSVLIERNDCQDDIHVITVVKFHNTLGRLYFTAIKPFHGIIVRRMIERICKNLDR